MCFEKAGEETLEKLARASGHRAAADSLRGSNSVEATRLLREAAEIFDSINRAASAAECFYDLGDYERAGILLISHIGRSRTFCSLAVYSTKGLCFCHSGCTSKMIVFFSYVANQSRLLLFMYFLVVG